MRTRLATVITSVFIALAVSAADVTTPGVATGAPPTTVPAIAKPGAATTANRPVTTCDYIPTPDNPAAKPIKPPRPTARTHGSVLVRIFTNYGAIAIRMDRSNAPCAVHNFTHLVRGHFYHRTQCWRLTNSSRLGVLQCGDIFAAEKGGPGYRFADEVTGGEKYPRGTVAMGNQGPDTNGSQFFIVHSFANIKPAYTVLGRVVAGMAVLDRIVAAGLIPGDTPDDGRPTHPVRIHLITTTP